VVATQQRDGDAGEPECLRELVAVVELLGHQRAEADHPGDRTRQDDRDQDHPLRVDAGGAGGGRVGARHAQVEAEATAVEEQPVPDADEDGEREEAVQGHAAGEVEADRREQPVEVGEVGRVGQRLGGRQVAAEVVAQRLGQQEGADADGDVVEHDRRDHLVDTAPDLEDAGDGGVGGADDDGDDEHEGDVQRRPQRDRRAGGGGEQRGQLVLAGGADVEQVHLEPDGDGHTGDVVRDGPVDDEDDRPGPVDVRPHRLERRDRALVGDQQGDRRHDDGDGGGQQGGEDLAEEATVHRCTLSMCGAFEGSAVHQ
jgi:hypothetical protein